MKALSYPFLILLVATFSSFWPIHSAVAQPANDDFADRVVLEGISQSESVDLADSSLEPGEPTAELNDLLGSAWYEYTAPSDGIIQITANGGSDNFYLGLYFSEAADLLNLSLIYISRETNTHLVQIPVTQGGRIYIQLFDANFDSQQTLAGPIDLGIALLQDDDIDSSNFVTISTMDNDDFEDRIQLEGSSTSAIGYFGHASVQSQEPLANTNITRTIWYEWEAPFGGWVNIGVRNYTLSSFSSVALSIWEGNVLPDLNLSAFTSNNDDPVVSIPGAVEGGDNIKIALSDRGEKIAALLDITLTRPFGEDSSTLDGGWNFSPYYGYYNDQSFPWIYHDQHGWQYVSFEGRGDMSNWIWDLSLGWLWISENAYPFIYSANLGWLYYDTSSFAPRWFFQYDTGMWLDFS